MQLPKDSPRVSRRDWRRGFAIIVTTSILVLLALVAVGLLTLSTVAVRSANLGAAQAEARANAKLALMLALGDLQKAAGPDSRITARAETLAQDPRLGTTVAANTAQAWWVGVSDSNPNNNVGPNNQPVVWLVSGLDPKSDPGAQVTGSPFKNRVKMYGDNTIDTAILTGGQPIEAGNVTLEDDDGRELGGFAYFVDDHGMKAQLAASHPDVRNDSQDPLGGGVLPGTYDLSILDGMDTMGNASMDDYARLGSLNDLPLIGVDKAIAREKRLGYTTVSRGVLSDVRKGGLKRDLTIAFENETVFNYVFPSRDKERYIVMDSEKLDQASELKKSGYIHWDVFKDYYNIKKYIGRVGRGDALDPVLFTKEQIFNNNNTLFGKGQLGPHAIGPNNGVPSRHQEMPYGDYGVMDQKASKNYKHSPVIPILSRMQQNAWVETIPPANGQSARIKTNVQLWTSHYNPYNINLKVVGDASNAGPRVITYPQVRFTIPRVMNKKSGLGGKRQSHVPHEVVLGPGRSHVCAFRNDGVINSENDRGLFDNTVRDLTLESVFSYQNLSSPLTGRVSLTVDFYLQQPSMSHGADHLNGSHELSQVFWSPFAWNAIDRQYPGKTITRTVDASELNENTMASHSFHLRTTREGSGSVRPLIDSNIRALLCNPKWDSPLGLPLLAGYSAENAGEADDQFFPMDTSDAPQGYTYWGAGREPSDGYDRVILFDIPREDLVSLGQLQHAGAGRFSYEPSYIVGNSYANLRIPLENWQASVQDTFSTSQRGLRQWMINGSFNLYDASYLVNEELWDSYIFTTIPQVRDNHNRGGDPNPTPAYFESVLAGEATLPNPRYLAYEPPGSTFDRNTLQDKGSARGTTGSFYHNAGHLLVDGAFNVNSTSIDAWEAFLSGTHELPYQQMSESGKVDGFRRAESVDGVRFPRVQSVLGGPMEKSSPDENYWVGFRSLEQDEVRELAEAIVNEVRERGPFLTLGEFVNRKLDYGDHGERGALQAALDKTVNRDIDNDFEEPAGHPDVPVNSTQGAGFPGQLLQGDILQALSPYMSVRSDTFTIRAYGESRNPGSKQVEARAWCEAVVQRYPDPIQDPDSAKSPLEELANPSSKFGRTFRIVSFRWLSPNEI